MKKARYHHFFKVFSPGKAPRHHVLSYLSEICPVYSFGLVLLIFALLASMPSAAAQVVLNKQVDLEWYDHPIPDLENMDDPVLIPYFKDALFSSEELPLPMFTTRIEVPGPGALEINFRIVGSSEPEFSVSPEVVEGLSAKVEPAYIIESDRGNYYARIFFKPFVSNSAGNVLLMESFALSSTFSSSDEETFTTAARSGFKYHSELAEGDIYKIAVPSAGLYKIDAVFLSDELGLQASEIPVDKIRVLGNRGGMLPQLAGAERVDDVEELPTRFVGSGTHLNQGEYLLFFAEGPQNWTYLGHQDTFDKPKNIYDNLNYYFISIGEKERLDVPQAGSLSGSEQTFDTYDFLQRYERDRVNLMGANPSFYGSGQRWFGDNLSNIRQKDYSSEFDLEGFIPGTQFEVYTEFAIRSNQTSTSRLNVGKESFVETVSSVNTSSVIGRFAHLGSIHAIKTVGEDPLTVHFEIPTTGSISESWMDFIQIRGKKELAYHGEPLFFRDSRSLDYNISSFEMRNPQGNDVHIWDVTDPHFVTEMPVESDGQSVRFTFFSNELKQFKAFHPTYNYPRPKFIEKVPNQNLHSLESAELVIVYHEDFESAAKELAEHRRNFSGLEVVVVPAQQVYNEFGGGSPDPTAIRDFARMFYTRTDDFRYLLLFGDGSYDYRGLMDGLPNQNFIPVYQTPHSLHAISAFPSDDYFGLLDPNEGANLVGGVDIAVGRLPVRTEREAQDVVNKIISYDTNPQSLGDWRLNLGFVADNGDNNLHLNQTRNLVRRVKENHPEYNIEKVFLDAFERVSTPGGNRFPDANKALNRMMNRGPLVINYLGHGGPAGWTQERVLQVPDILSWSNSDQLSLMITATCSFANYDDPAITSGGEHTLLNPNGGVFGLLTTTRLVYAFANERLNREVLNRLFVNDQQERPTIGEVMRLSKNANSADTLNVNARKFTLLGDQSQKLNIPEYRVVTTSVNGADINQEAPDTLKAMQHVVIAGEVRDHQDKLLGDFNGVMEFTLFDKPVVESTLGQGPRSNKQEFEVQNKVLFKGSASVEAGHFIIEFKVPLDINYEPGYGKASYFAYTEDMRTAAGAYEDLIIGGSVDSLPENVQGPQVRLYMNNENFVSGGITDANPTLLAKLESEVGINVTGNSIGRELTAYLSGESSEKITLNDYYQAEKDDFTRGEVRYPFRNLEDGSYEINFIAWDILNNRGEASLEFVVASDRDRVIQQLFNFPNPMSDHTEIQFEHNLPPGKMDIRVTVLSVDGKLVGEMESSAFSDGYRVTGLKWDGTTHSGSPLPNGLYFFNVEVRTDHPDADNKTVKSEFERLVIMR